VAVGVALAATASALVAMRHGPSVGTDSVTYVSVARNLADGRGFTDFTGGTVTQFPPAYPALLAAGERIGIDAFSLARVTNALVLGATVLLAYVLLRRHVASTWLTIGATALVAFSGEMLRITGFVATDPLLVALTLAFVILMEDIRSKPDRRVVLIMTAGGLTSVAFLVRYAAVPLVLSGVVVVAVYSMKDGWPAMARRTIGFAGVASVVPALWYVRSAVSGTAVGSFRAPTDDTPLMLARDLASSTKDLVFSYRVPDVAALAAVLAGVVLVAALSWSCRQELVPRLARRAAAMLPSATVVVLGTAFVVFSRKTAGSDLNPRILLPMWFPAIVLGAWFFDNLLTSGRRCGRAVLTRCVSVGLVALLAGSIVFFVQQVAKGTDTTYRYSSPSSTAIRRALATLAPGTRILSNNPWHVYLATDKQPVFLAPMKLQPGFSHRPIPVRDVTRALCTRPVVLVWFDESPATLHRSRVEQTLRGRAQLALTAPRRVDGATVYAVEPGESAPACS
jgi:hypothetical protein